MSDEVGNQQMSTNEGYSFLRKRDTESMGKCDTRMSMVSNK